MKTRELNQHILNNTYTSVPPEIYHTKQMCTKKGESLCCYISVSVQFTPKLSMLKTFNNTVRMQ